MKSFLLRKKTLRFFLIFALLTLNYGCQKEPLPNTAPGNLHVNSIFITQTHHSHYIDLPNGSYMPDNPNFSINNPTTWTGNMAQYVVDRYTYSVSIHVTNSGKGTGYDAEVDVGYFFTSGPDEFETFFIGDLPPYGEKMKTVEIVSYNRQLEECAGEVYWYNY